ncbi:MAG: hypothetical protein KAR33_06820, partial [Candidatus Thorarchaeota archaeon]|nr:hypothetical protein [Candidatus Thorarchaeota archaeon]
NRYRVEVGLDLYVNMTIPKSFMGVGNTLNKVTFWGVKNDAGGSSLFVLEYNITADRWAEVSVHYQPGSETPGAGDFLELFDNQSVFSQDSNNYYVDFSIEFVEDIGIGYFLTGMNAIDQLGRPVSTSWLARLKSGTFETPPIAIGAYLITGQFALPDYYYAEVVDENDELLHYVDAYDNFTFKLQANEPFGEVMIPFSTLTFEPEYMKPVSFSVKNNPMNFFSLSTPITEVNPTLMFVYNGTHAYTAVGYLDNVTWTWVPEMAQWAPSIDFELNDTIDWSEFWEETETTVENNGAWLTWSGHYTNSTDMDADPYGNGGTINGEPYFWKVWDLDGEAMYARPEILNLHTVQLGFKDLFMEGFVKMDGEVVRRADPGDILNVSLIIHAPGGEINGTTFIPMNETNVEVDVGTYIDIAGAWITTIRNNVTLQLFTNGFGENETHWWRTRATHELTMDLNTDQAWSNSSVQVWMYNADRTAFIGYYQVHVSDIITVLDHNFELGAEVTNIDFDIVFTADAPAMKIDDVGLVSGVVQAWQLNVSEAGLNTWQKFPDPMNFTDPSVSARGIQTFDKSRMLWSPAHFVLGNYTLWEPQKWTITDEGAIDLDGNVFTTEDQYFVKRTGFFESWGNTTVEGMWVGVGFDPSPGDPGDEFVSTSWMGVATLEVEFDANETFYWYHADDFSSLTLTEVEDVQEIMWADLDGDIPSPGYDWVSWLSKNRTLELGALTGLEDNYWKTSWFAWGTQQVFQVATSEASTTWAAFQAKYAGLLIFNDLDPDGAGPQEPNKAPDFDVSEGNVVTDEVTHVVLIDDVDSLELRRPFGATNDTGNVVVSPDTEVTFGISIYDVVVSIYPIQVENSDGLRGPWAFRESYEGALGLNSTNFDYWVSHATIEEMAFDITFNVDMVEYDAADAQTWNHAIAFKIDQTIGNWTLSEFDNSVLDNKSLAVNFFAVLGTATATVYTAGEQPVTDTNGESMEADYYQFGSANSPFANVSMGGLPYYWAGDGYSTEYTSGSSTAPIGAFSLMFESESGDTIANFQVDASMLFMTAGYTNWGGQKIIVDPVFVSYTSAHQTPSGTTTTTTTGTTTTTSPTTTIPPGGGDDLGLMVMVGGIIFVAVIACVMARRRR